MFTKKDLKIHTQMQTTQCTNKINNKYASVFTNFKIFSDVWICINKISAKMFCWGSQFFCLMKLCITPLCKKPGQNEKVTQAKYEM